MKLGLVLLFLGVVAAAEAGSLRGKGKGRGLIKGFIKGVAKGKGLGAWGNLIKRGGRCLGVIIPEECPREETAALIRRVFYHKKAGFVAGKKAEKLTKKADRLEARPCNHEQPEDEAELVAQLTQDLEDARQSLVDAASAYEVAVQEAEDARDAGYATADAFYQGRITLTDGQYDTCIANGDTEESCAAARDDGYAFAESLRDSLITAADDAYTTAIAEAELLKEEAESQAQIAIDDALAALEEQKADLSPCGRRAVQILLLRDRAAKALEKQALHAEHEAAMRAAAVEVCPALGEDFQASE